MKVKHVLNEGLSDEAHTMEMDHEVQMARAQLYHAAKDAIRLHKILQNITEREGLEGWVAAKITTASDYLKSVADYMEYEQMAPSTEGIAPLAPMSAIAMPEDASGGSSSAGGIASVAKPLGGKMLKRSERLINSAKS